MDGLNTVVQVPGENNPDPRGLEGNHAQPLGGLRYYQDDLDTSKADSASDEVGDDPSKRIVGGAKKLAVALAQEDEVALDKTNDDLREELEDRDEGDRADK